MRSLALCGLFCFFPAGCGKSDPKPTAQPVTRVQVPESGTDDRPENRVNTPPADPPTERPARKRRPTPQPDEVARLVERLKDGNDRAEAATELGKLGAKAVPAVPELLTALDDKDADVRTQAAKALVAVGRQPVSAVLDFFADWCPPCRQMKPLTEKLVKEGLPIIVIDIDKHDDVSEKFNVRSIPTYIALKEDEQVSRLVGARSEQELRDLVAKAGPPAGAVKPGLDDPAGKAALIALVVGLSDADAWTRFQAEAGLRSRPQVGPALTALMTGKYPALVRGGAVQGLLVVAGGKGLPEEARQALAKALADEKESADMRGYAAVILGTGKSPPAEVAPALTAALSKGQSPDLRVRAATRLGELGNDKAVPALTLALRDKASPVRVAAAEALGKLGPAALSAVPELLAAHGRDDHGVYRTTLERLVQAGDAVPALATALADPHEDVRLMAVELLARSADPAPAAKALENALKDIQIDVQVGAAQILHQLGGYEKRILPVLIHGLDAEDANKAEDVLSGMGRRAVPELAKALVSENGTPLARRRLARLLSQEKPFRKAAPALREALQSEDESRRTCAALVLSRITPADEKVVAVLLAGASSKDEETRRDCRHALVEMKAQAVVPSLVAALGGKDEKDRDEASYALSRLELDEKTVDQIIPLLGKKETRNPAATALHSAVGKWPKVIPPLIEAVAAGRGEGTNESAARALANAGKPALPALLQLAEDANRPEAVRAEAVGLFGQVEQPVPEAAARLGALLKGPSKAVRLKAAVVLASRWQHPEALPVLTDALANLDKDSATEVLTALGELGPKAAATADRLIELVKKGDSDSDTTAVTLARVTSDTGKGVPALLELLKAGGVTRPYIFTWADKPAVPHLVRALSDDAYPRPLVIEALGHLGPKAADAVPALTKLLGDKDRSVAIAAAGALAMIAPKTEAAAPVLVEALRSSNAGVRQNAIHRLAALGPSARSAVPALIQALNDPSVRGIAAHTLGAIGPDAAEAVEPLTRMLGTRDRLYAIGTLGLIGPKAAPAVPALIQLLDRGGTRPYYVAETLRQIGGPARDAVAVLIRQAADEDLRLEALEALREVRELDPEAALAEFLKRADDPEPECRMRAVQGLGPTKAEKALPVLLKAISDPEPDVRRAAVSSIGHLGPAAAPAVPTLTALMDGKEQQLRGIAVQALGELGPTGEPAIPALIKALDDKALRHAAAHSLALHGAKAVAAVPRLTARLEDTDTRHSAAHALGEIGPGAKDALPKLRALLDDPALRLKPTIEQAIQKIDGKK